MVRVLTGVGGSTGAGAAGRVGGRSLRHRPRGQQHSPPRQQSCHHGRCPARTGAVPDRGTQSRRGPVAAVGHGSNGRVNGARNRRSRGRRLTGVVRGVVNGKWFRDHRPCPAVACHRVHRSRSLEARSSARAPDRADSDSSSSRSSATGAVGDRGGRGRAAVSPPGLRSSTPVRNGCGPAVPTLRCSGVAKEPRTDTARQRDLVPCPSCRVTGAGAFCVSAGHGRGSPSGCVWGGTARGLLDVVRCARRTRRRRHGVGELPQHSGTAALDRVPVVIRDRVVGDLTGPGALCRTSNSGP